MTKLKKAIQGTEICLSGGLPDRCKECPYHYNGCSRQLTEDSLALLKRQRWHFFRARELDEEEKQEHPNWNFIMETDCHPGNGEEILWYRKCFKTISLTSWDDDMWAEYGCTADGDDIEDGDAWMELPEPPSGN